jgi:DNA-binding FadR family transcriptional regulator
MMSLRSPVRAETLSTQVARQIEDLITSGAWPLGTRIPPENDLVAKLRVSRNTVREALRSLVHTGMLEARAGDGTYVRALSELATPLVRRARRARLDDAVEMRVLLEQQAARLAALRRGEDDIARLRELLHVQKAASAAGDSAAYAAADDELHRAVVACARNELLAEIYEHLGGALKLSVSPDLWDQALAAEEIDYHATLVEAIAAGNPVAAEKAAVNLIDVLKDALLPSDGKVRRHKRRKP